MSDPLKKMDNNQAMALIEFVRNHASDLCQNIAVTHFADRLALEQENIDPLEIATATGADQGAAECRNDIQQMDCHALLQEFLKRQKDGGIVWKATT